MSGSVGNFSNSSAVAGGGNFGQGSNPQQFSNFSNNSVAPSIAAAASLSTANITSPSHLAGNHDNFPANNNGFVTPTPVAAPSIPKQQQPPLAPHPQRMASLTAMVFGGNNPPQNIPPPSSNVANAFGNQNSNNSGNSIFDDSIISLPNKNNQIASIPEDENDETAGATAGATSENLISNVSGMSIAAQLPSAASMVVFPPTSQQQPQQQPPASQWGDVLDSTTAISQRGFNNGNESAASHQYPASWGGIDNSLVSHVNDNNNNNNNNNSYNAIHSTPYNLNQSTTTSAAAAAAPPIQIADVRAALREAMKLKETPAFVTPAPISSSASTVHPPPSSSVHPPPSSFNDSLGELPAAADEALMLLKFVQQQEQPDRKPTTAAGAATGIESNKLSISLAMGDPEPEEAQNQQLQLQTKPATQQQPTTPGTTTGIQINFKPSNRSKTKPIPKLPPNWTAFLDPKTKRVFFWNSVTKESSWRPPPEPTVEDVAGMGGLSLEALLRPAFLIFEKMFIDFDADGAGTITFTQLCRRLSSQGFYDTETLLILFEKVDYDKGGTLDFGEFLMLMYFWSEMGSYTVFVKDKKVADSMDLALRKMEEAFAKYDADNSRELNQQELQTFMQAEFAGLMQSQNYKELLAEVMPSRHSILEFRDFLCFLYSLLCPQRTALMRGVQSEVPLFQQLKQAFLAMEQDFLFFDEDDSGYIDWVELTQGVSNLKPAGERVDVLAIMTFYFQKVDFDRSESVDFFEFLYLAYLVIKDGCYSDMVVRAANAAVVKHGLTQLRKLYKEYDKDQSGRLEWDELVGFFADAVGNTPPTAFKIFEQLKTGSREKPHVNFLNFMRMLYMIILPLGKFAGKEIPKPDKPPPRPAIPAMVPRVRRRPKRVDRVDLSQIRKENVVGKGGFGTVYKATYNNTVVAAKFWNDNASPEDLDEADREMQLLSFFDHDNIVFLIGGNMGNKPQECVLLTEFCPNGSVFDTYAKKRMRFELFAQWRLAKEVAMALNVLHTCTPVLMHRDIKSANVLLDENFTCKLADFGFACDPRAGENVRGMGTPHWSAPEVLNSTRYDERADVFSFGVYVWELAHMKIPYVETGWDQAMIVKQVVRNNVRPEFSSECHPILKNLIMRCWNRDPSARPTMQQVIDELNFRRAEFSPPDETEAMLMEAAYPQGVDNYLIPSVKPAANQKQVVKKEDKRPAAPTNILEAAEMGDVNYVRYYLQQNPENVFMLSAFDDTPLHLSSRHGADDCVLLLLEAGAHPNDRGEGGNSALHEAAYGGHLSLVRILLSRGAYIDDANEAGSTPLHVACYRAQTEVVDFLLANGADVNARSYTGATPLHDACRGMRSDKIVQTLCAANADINAMDEDGIRPLHCAAETGRLHSSRLLISLSAEVDAQDYNGNTALHAAARSGQGSFVVQLIQMGAKTTLANFSGKRASEVASNKDICNLLWRENNSFAAF